MAVHHRVLLTSSFARVQPEGVALALVLWCATRDAPELAGLLLAATTFPQLISGPLVGRALDRAARPTRTAAFAAGASATACALLVVSDLRPIPSVMAAIVLSVSTPALTGGISSLVIGWSDDHAKLAAWDSTGYNLAGLAAPVVVTVAAASRPQAAIAALGAASLVAGAVLLSGDEPARADPVHTVGEPVRVRDAVAVIVRSGPLRAATLATTTLSAGLGGLELAIVAAVVARGLPPERAGVLATVIAVFAFVGSIILTRVTVARSAAAMTLWAVGATGIVLIALSASTWWVMVAFAAILGLLDAPLLVGTYRVRTESSPPTLRSGVFTLAASAKLGAGSLGALGAAAVLTHGSPDLALVLIGATGILGALLGAVTLWRRSGPHRDVDLQT